jgi:leader peptidase (prepilin peptidase)/N-methyltransferase
VPGFAGAALALIVAAIALVDARHFLIPNELTAAGLVLGLINAAVLAPDAMPAAVACAMAGAVLLAAAFLGLRMAYRLWRGRDGLGLGDVNLAGVAGAWLSWLMIPLAIEIAALAALAVYGVWAYLGSRPFQRAARLPFGLFFAPAIWLCWLAQAWLGRA